MNTKEKLIEFKEKLLQLNIPISKDFEFDAELEDHPIGNQNIYRLYYINYHRIGEGYGHRKNNIGIINWRFNPFILPKEMTREEGFKVLSYLTDFIEKREDTEPCSFKSVSTLDGVLNLERFGFTRVEEKDESKMDFYKATIGTLVVPNSKIDVSPDVFRPKDTCYIYVVKLNIAQHYPMKEIRRRRLYDRRMVTKKDFRNHLFEYRTSGIKDSPLVH